MKIIDLTLTNLRKAGRIIGPRETARWRDLARSVTQCATVDYSDDGPHTTVCVENAADLDLETLAGIHAKAERPLRLVGLDDALLLENCSTLFSQLRKTNLPLHAAFGNSLGCATALGITWLLQGGESLCCSFAGIGNCAPLEEVLAALHLSGTGHFSGLSLLPQLRRLFLRLSGISHIAGSKPIIGSLLFTVESGIHVDGLRKDPSLYEPFSPELVGAQRRVVLGAHSGCASVRLCCEHLGLTCDAILVQQLLRAVRSLSRRNERALCEKEFLAVYASVRQETGCASALAC